MVNAASIRQGDRVSGTYMGVPFTGTVTDARFHTMNYETVMVFVRPFDPVTLPDGYHNPVRTSVLVHVYADGSNADSYIGAGFGDSITEHTQS
jgi:hypothetical protein